MVRQSRKAAEPSIQPPVLEPLVIDEAEATSNKPEIIERRQKRQKEQILRALGMGMSVVKACNVSGITKKTYYRWREADAAFDAECDEAYKSGTESLEDAMMEKAVRMDDSASVTAGIFILKARKPEMYRERSTVEHTGNITVSKMSDDDLREEVARLMGMATVQNAKQGSD